MSEINADLNKPSFSSRLCSWIDQLLSQQSSLPAAWCTRASLLRSCNTALSMVRDTGYEGALHFLDSACTDASKDVQQKATRPEAAQPEAAHQEAQQEEATKQAGAQQEASQQRPAQQEASQQSTAQQSSAQQSAAQQAASSTSAASAPDKSPVERFLEALSAKVCNLSNVVNCLRANAEGQVSTLPKFQKLVVFLAELKAEKEKRHGIVFVKERQAVFQLTRMLQTAPQLAGITFHPFTGQGKASTVRATIGSAASSMAAVPVGMKASERANAFQRFKQAKGREVLVATSAAEEGVDVPGCEFVVCYTTVESGRELTQKQGRARAMGSRFVQFIESDTTDAVMQEKARLEQVGSQLAQQLHLGNGKCCQV